MVGQDLLNLTRKGHVRSETTPTIGNGRWRRAVILDAPGSYTILSIQLDELRKEDLDLVATDWSF